MKILYVQDSLGTGGAERSNAELWYFLRAKEIHLKIVVLEHRKVGIESEILSAGFDVVFLKGRNIIAHSRQLASIIREYQPDIVHSVLFRATFMTRLARGLIKFFHVESLVNCTYSKIRFQDPQVNRFLLFLYKIADRFSAAKTDIFIAITDEVRKHYTQAVGIPEEKIVVIHRGRPQNPFLPHRDQVRAELRRELKLSTGEIVFVHAGRQEFQKGHLILLQALKRIEKQLENQPVSFLMCGRDGNATESIKDYLRNTELHVHLLWLGHRKDLLRVLAGADVFVFPSLYEGMGGVLIEAQAAALPIICSDLPVFDEVVKPGANALTFTNGDHLALSECILSLVNATTEARVMGAKSLEHYEQKFRIEDINEKVFNFYKSVVK
jgi:glycosyltransferase involved in cell wall biosynthesis